MPVFWMLLFILSSSTASPLSKVTVTVQEDFNYWRREGVKEIYLSRNLNQPIRNLASNVILFLGDGMGISTVSAARIYKGQRAQPRMGYGEETYLEFERFPNVALVKTYNTDRTTPDSAATATAYLCGVKANMGTIGVDNHVFYKNCTSYQDKYAVNSLWIDARKQGKSVGIVTTTRVTHATPAGTYAWTPDRDWESDKQRNKDVKDPNERKKCRDIASQLITNAFEFNVIFGGGRKMFFPRNKQMPGGKGTNGTREDGRDLVQEWTDEHLKKGHRVKSVFTKSDLQKVQLDNVDYIMGLFSDDHLTYDEKRKDSDNEPNIQEMTEAAIKVLSRNPKGFVLLVEGGRIDHGHHHNQARYALGETVAMERAIKVALQKTSRSDTLIMVTADHSHVFTFGGYAARGKDILGGAGDNNFPQGELADDNKPYSAILYANGPSAVINQPRKDTSKDNTTAFGYKFPSLVPLEIESHGGEDVGVYAIGPWSDLFRRVHEQTHVNYVARFATCLPPFDGSECQADNSGRKSVTWSWAIVLLICSLSAYFISH